MFKIITGSAAETFELGARLGRVLEPGDFIALVGDLGAGKTQFTKGIAEGLEVDTQTPITSPTYTILNIYEGRLPLYHFDLYRLSGAEEIEDLGFHEYFFGAGVCVVEWAERLGEELPPQAVTISFAHAGGDGREIFISLAGSRAESLLKLLFPE